MERSFFNCILTHIQSGGGNGPMKPSNQLILVMVLNPAGKLEDVRGIL